MSYKICLLKHQKNYLTNVKVLFYGNAYFPAHSTAFTSQDSAIKANAHCVIQY